TNDRREYASEHDKYQGPCTGKDTKFVIGTPWKKEENEVNKRHKDVLLPPRRRHMYDLLLATIYEGQHIKNNLGKDISGICTDIKYSFADLGDIIHKLPGDKRKYNDNINHLKFREDWWSANSTKFWEAMHCASKAGGIECGGDPTLEDYIPQRLRWLSEWADNYCKMVKTDYKSMSDEKWKPDWEKQQKKKKKKKKNKELYDNCNSGARSSNDPIQDELDNFIVKRKENQYINAPEEFIDAMRGYAYCKEENHSKYLDTEHSDDSYVFKEIPNHYK
ncbi:hypothetical protein PFAG_06125, partial [Plasmodium falciparum Santa Lucia]